ncbi:XkdX family protein [Cohnella phaseoli]|uniref:Putative XkdX family phage protein n=1 Tax=Cohnella phaseoli TaxID=456490 RepID=A0A3D9KJD3_9BACL|nr:XkdX family protein [Cohnella phaseoli]RED86267.1 putative XkdX family phage protein [Cohnella phaseoli]
MDWFATGKRHYDAERYSNADVAKFVIADKITVQQYESITDERYEGFAKSRLFN